MIDRADSLMPVGVRWCEQGQHAYSGSVCPRGCRKASESAAAPPDKERPAARRAPSSKPSGSASEDRLAEQLEAMGMRDVVRCAFGLGDGALLLSAEPPRLYIRQFAWALDAKPPRKFASDFAFPWSRLLVEIKGGAHAAGRRKVRSDVEREGLAVSLGWRVLPLTPEQVKDGTALALVRAALGATT